MADQPSTRRTDFGPLYLPNLIAALVASVGLVIGSIGPWINFFGVMSRGGMDGDGIFTLIMGIAALAALFGVLNLGLMGGKPKLMMSLSIVAVIAGVLGAVIGLWDIIDVFSRSAEFFGETVGPEVAWGLWLVLISSVTLIATAAIVYYQARRESGRRPPPGQAVAPASTGSKPMSDRAGWLMLVAGGVSLLIVVVMVVVAIA